MHASECDFFGKFERIYERKKIFSKKNKKLLFCAKLRTITRTPNKYGFNNNKISFWNHGAVVT